MVGWRVLGAAALALDAGCDPLKLQFCAFSHRLPRQEIKVELDRLVDKAGQFTDGQVDGQDAPRSGPFPVPQGNIQNALGNRILVHGRYYTTTPGLARILDTLRHATRSLLDQPLVMPYTGSV